MNSPVFTCAISMNITTFTSTADTSWLVYLFVLRKYKKFSYSNCEVLTSFAYVFRLVLQVITMVK